jgi:periplasmic nitrate reductase NapD
MWRGTPVEKRSMGNRIDAGRRNFLAKALPLKDIEIAGILVQALPAALDRVAATLAAMPGTEIHQRDDSGKLVVVIEAETVDAVGARLHEIAMLPGVLNANLAFHATDRA